MVSLLREDIDGSLLRAALEVLAERHGESYLLARSDGLVLYATRRARELLGARGQLPEALTQRAQAALAGDDALAREVVVVPGSRFVVEAWIAALPRSLCHVLFALREHGPQTALAQRLAERLALTPRAAQLALLACRGLKYKEIGEQLQLSEATVKTYMHALFREVGVRSRAELAALVERVCRML